MAAPEEFNVLSGMTANVVADMSQLMRAQASVVVVPATAVFAGQ